MICPSCQHENREGANFCDECGGKLEVVCPQCSRVNRPEAKFCDGCGHDLRKPKEATPIDYQQPRSYTPKFLVDKILTSRSAIEGERKLVTVLFADVAGFTPMSEKLDPEDVHEIMDGCFRILMDEIHRYEGTVNEFRGDGLMALFGAPVAHEDHAQRACHAALAAQKALSLYAEKLQKRHGVEFKVRIGLNSGPVVVGAIGDDLRMDYTAQGDTANLAARMESNAPAGGVLVSNHIYRQAKEFFEFDPVGELHVKGKEKPVEAYRLIKPTEVETRIAASAVKGLTRFVGRSREMETLKEAFEKVQSGEGQVVGIVGEAGVGKSRLLLEFRNKLAQGEYLYLEGRSLHYGSSMPYLPVLDALRSYLGIKEGEQESVIKERMMKRIVGSDENLTRCLPPLQELFSLKVDDDEFRRLEPKEKREKTFEALRDIFIRGSQSKPIVLAIEDLHWIDRTTEEFLDYMIGWLPGAHILLILLYRPEYTHQWGSKSYYAQIGVGQLSSGTSAELVKAILEAGEVAPELRELVLSRTSGNPLFMEELTHTLLENGSIVRRGDRYVLAETSSEIAVPDTIQGIIAGRMDRLEENLKRIIQVASVIGREFAFRILHAITEMKDDLKSNLLNLQGLEFIYEKSLFPELEYIFRHALIQEVAYTSLLLKRRKEIHARIGRALEELYPDRLEEFYEMLAYHYSKSENSEKAYDYLRLSGDKAARSNSPWEAFCFYRNAGEVASGMPRSDENKRRQLAAIRSLAAVVRAQGYPEDTVMLLEEGVELARELGDRKSLVAVQTQLGVYCMMVGGDPIKGREYIEDCLRQSDATEDVRMIAPIAYDLCVSYQTQGDYRPLLPLARNAIRLIEDMHMELESFGRVGNLYSILLALYGLSLGAVGDFDSGIPWLDKSIAFSHKANDVYSICLGELYYGSFYYFKGDGSGTVMHYEKSIVWLEKLQVTMLLGLTWSWLGYGYFLLGDLDAAVEHMEKGLKIQTEHGIPFWLCEHHWGLSEVHCEMGKIDRARLYAEQALELARKEKIPWWQGRSLITLGRTIGKSKRAEVQDGVQHILRGIEILEPMKARPMYARGYLALGELYADALQSQVAKENLRKAETMFQEMGMDYWLGKTQEVLARL